jgi:DNA-binding NarL/FixJ family response regulator
VARLVAQGLSNREAAARLFVSQRTVESHLGNVFTKLGINSPDQAGQTRPRLGRAGRVLVVSPVRSGPPPF